MTKVLSVVGNRPQFIKSAPLSVALREAGIDEVVLHTGQHWDPAMSQVFFDELGIPEPAYRLDLRTSDPQAMTPPIREVIEGERPDWVRLRRHQLDPGRGACRRGRGADRARRGRSAELRPVDARRAEPHRGRPLSALLFCPDKRSALQLEQEGVPGRREVVGDVMADATRIFEPLVRRRASAYTQPYTVLTIHRQANTEPVRLRAIVDAIGGADRRFVFPVHPRTQHALDEHGLRLPAHVEAIEPLGYLEMLALVAAAEAVVTDSGGLQKEAYWLRVPCVTLRPSTEWVDTVTAGANRLAEPAELAAALETARFPAQAPRLYGDGHASERIAAALYA